jgi:16S rRNA (cytosine967-C5)-methyltransferase
MGEPLSTGRLGKDASPYLSKTIPEHEHFFIVPHGMRIEDLPGYREGLFLVTDPFAMNAVELLAPQPGEAVLDACAAPGGKTFLVAERMRAKGKLLAVDRDEQRLLRLQINLQRLGISDFVETMKRDILDFTGNTEKYDRILADVPCSNTGVIRRKPDVRWNFSLKSLARLTVIQAKMLAKLASLLKPGGRFVYSTCSLEPEENQLLISSWLKNNPGFSLLEERHFFPPESNTDGGYAAAIVKK